jgi:hypothetical protein
MIARQKSLPMALSLKAVNMKVFVPTRFWALIVRVLMGMKVIDVRQTLTSVKVSSVKTMVHVKTILDTSCVIVSLVFTARTVKQHKTIALIHPVSTTPHVSLFLGWTLSVYVSLVTRERCVMRISMNALTVLVLEVHVSMS